MFSTLFFYMKLKILVYISILFVELQVITVIINYSKIYVIVQLQINIDNQVI